MKQQSCKIKYTKYRADSLTIKDDKDFVYQDT